MADLSPGAPPAAGSSREALARASAGRLGMRLFLASLGMLFGGCLVGYLVIRLRAPEWPPPGSPGLPGGLWISTLVLVLLSAALVLAERAVRNDRSRDLTRLLWVALLLAIAFLAAQVANWMRMAAGSVTPQQSLLAFGFWVLTFLHAAHVLLGLIPLVIVALRSGGGRYTAANSEGVHLVAMYWHFLFATWIAIFVVLNF